MRFVTSLFLALLAQEVPVVHENPPFHLKLPDGYTVVEPNPAGSGLSYSRISDGDPTKAIGFSITVMQNPSHCRDSSQKELESSLLPTLPAGSTVRLSHIPWKGYPLGVQESLFSAQGFEFIALAVHVPLAPRPIHLTLGGFRSSEPEIRKDLERILATLDGRTTWVSMNQRQISKLAFLGWSPLMLLLAEFILTATAHRYLSLRINQVRIILCLAIAVLMSLNIVFLASIWIATENSSAFGIAFSVVGSAFFFRRVRILKERRFQLEGAAFLEKGLLADALACYERGLKKFPASHNLRNDIGIGLIGLGRYAEARQLYTDLLADRKLPSNIRACAYANLCDMVLRMPDGAALLEEANRWSEEAVRLMKSLPAIRGIRGAILIERGRIDEGLTLLRESFDVQHVAPGSRASMAAWIAIGLQKQGKAEESKSFFDQARSLDPACFFLSRLDGPTTSPSL